MARLFLCTSLVVLCACGDDATRTLIDSGEVPGATVPPGFRVADEAVAPGFPVDDDPRPVHPMDGSYVDASDVPDEPPSRACAAICTQVTEEDDAGIGDDEDGGSSLPVSQLEATAVLTHGPVLGAVTDRSIKVWARGDLPGRFAVRAWAIDDPSVPHCSETVGFDDLFDLTGVGSVHGLQPNTAYAYRVEVMDELRNCLTVASSDATFWTLPREGEPAQIRFAVGADVRGANVPGFADIEAVAPDFVLMIGDNVYADDRGYVENDYEQSFALYRTLYQRVWGGPQFRSLFSNIAVFMTWDDHELMDNYWRGKDDLRYSVGRALYDAYQGSHNPSPAMPAELYYSFRAGDIGFFVLDTRTHRDGNMDADDAEKSMLGTAQRQAFEEWLAADDSAVHVVVSSVLVSSFSTTGLDAWSSFTRERDDWLELIAAHRTSNTIIISGDQHWSAILRLSYGVLEPYVAYEFQTTPLGSGLRGRPRADEAVMALDNTHQVFGLFEIDTRLDPPVLDFTLCAVGAACVPHEEPPPVTTSSGTSVPYSVRFVGGERGFTLVNER